MSSSTVPETFSYTKRAIMMPDMPLVYFPLGAPAERIGDYRSGRVITDMKLMLDTALSLVRDARDGSFSSNSC